MDVIKLFSFLDEFDKNIRQKISKLDEKLNKLERTVDHLESIKQSKKFKSRSNLNSVERVSETGK